MISLFIRRALLCLGLVFGLLAPASAQSWSNDPQLPTREDLWGIAHADNILIAVGQRGTVLHYDYEIGLWQPRVLNTDAWLVGVGQGAGRWVIVGDRGSIYTSDDNGDTWTARDSGTTQRLNAVAYGDGLWLTIGEAGTVLTSPDGTTWTVRPPLGAGFLRALAFGRGRFLLGGGGGTLFTTTDGVAFNRITLATQSDIEAAAITTERFYVSGSQGLMAVAEQAEGNWRFLNSTQATNYRGLAVRTNNLVAAFGDRLVYLVGGLLMTSGSSASSDRAPQFLATAATLGRDESVVVGLGGRIARASFLTSVSISANVPETNRQLGGAWTNVIYGSPVTLTASVPSDITSGAYRWRRDGADLPGETRPELSRAQAGPGDTGRYDVVVTIPGRTVTSGTFYLSVIPGGRPEVIDPNFNPPERLRVVSLINQPDGKLLVIGSVGPTDGTLTNQLFRLNADGSLDQGFRGEVNDLGGSVARLRLLPDGRIYVTGAFRTVRGQPNPGLVRLLPDGALDGSFAPESSVGVVADTPLAATSGKVYLQTSRGVERLLPDGRIDPTFSGPKTGFLAHLDPADRYIISTLTQSGFDSTTRYTRYFADDRPDPASNLAFVQRSGFTSGYVTRELWAGDDLFGLTQGLISKGGGSTYSFRRSIDGTTPAGYRSWSASVSASTGFETAYVFRPNGGAWISGGPGLIAWPQRAYSPLGAYQPELYAALPNLASYSCAAIGTDEAIYAWLQRSGRTTLARIRPITGAVGRLSNLSVRAHVASAAEPLITGFVTTGTGETRALVRAIGPALGQFGVEGALRDPQLTLTRDGAHISGNDNWDAALASRFGALGAFPLAEGSRDAALEAAISAGNYTAVVQPGTDDSGVALVELYESADTLAPRRFTNVSARGTVAADRPLIVGFTITGQVPATVLIRAVGPTLGDFGVAGALGDPSLKLYRSDTALWENNDWKYESLPNYRNIDLYADPVSQAGAFVFTPGSKDAAMLVTLAPGSYTAQVSAGGVASGVVLVEVYEVP